MSFLNLFLHFYFNYIIKINLENGFNTILKNGKNLKGEELKDKTDFLIKKDIDLENDAVTLIYSV